MEQKGIKIIKELIAPLEYAAIVVPHKECETTIICDYSKEACELKYTIHKETEDIYIFKVHDIDENELRKKLSFKVILKKISDYKVVVTFKKTLNCTDKLLAVKYLKESFKLTLSSAKKIIDELWLNNVVQCKLILSCSDHKFIDEFTEMMEEIGIKINILHETE